MAFVPREPRAIRSSNAHLPSAPAPTKLPSEDPTRALTITQGGAGATNIIPTVVEGGTAVVVVTMEDCTSTEMMWDGEAGVLAAIGKRIL